MVLMAKSARASKWATIIHKLKIEKCKFLMQVLMADFVQLSYDVAIFLFVVERMGSFGSFEVSLKFLTLRESYIYNRT